jgi:membrane protein
MRSSVAVVRRVLSVAQAVRVPFLAAAVAYYAFVSLVPLLVLALALGSVLGGEALAVSVVEALSGFLSAEGESLVTDALMANSGRSGITILGLVLLTWSGLKVFRAVDDAFSQVYGVADRKSLSEQLVGVTVVLGSVAVSVTAVVALNGLLPRLDGIPFLDILGVVLSFSILPLSFLPMYYRFPDVPMTLREALPGALIAGAGWVALVVVFRIYAQFAGNASLYGVLGGVLLVITFLYLAASVMIVGAVANAVLAGRTDEDRKIEEAELPEGVPDIREVAKDVQTVKARLQDRTVDRADLESELRAYVRHRSRREHARGWGPYLVLLYGTAMTIAAFYFLSGGWAILAMLVIWLSTLGLYVVMLVVGVGLGAISAPRRVVNWIRSWRS